MSKRSSSFAARRALVHCRVPRQHRILTCASLRAFRTQRATAKASSTRSMAEPARIRMPTWSNNAAYSTERRCPGGMIWRDPPAIGCLQWLRRGVRTQARQTGYAQHVLYSFKGEPDGANPYSGVVATGGGILYGTTCYGGTAGFGTVFSLRPQHGGYVETILHEFGGLKQRDGSCPYGGLIVGAGGTLFGTTELGGAPGCSSGCGTVFALGQGGSTYDRADSVSLPGTQRRTQPICRTPGRRRRSALRHDLLRRIARRRVPSSSSARPARATARRFCTTFPEAPTARNRWRLSSPAKAVTCTARPTAAGEPTAPAAAAQSSN